MRQRVRFRVTEFDVVMEASHVKQLLEGALSLEKALSDEQRASDQENDSREREFEIEDLGAVRSAGGNARPTYSRRSRGRAQLGRDADLSDEVVRRIVVENESALDRYSEALTAHDEPGKLSLLALRLASPVAKDGLTSNQIAKLLEDTFQINVPEPSIRMALVRSATKEPTLLSTTRTSKGTLFRLTRGGMRASDTLLSVN